MKKLIIKSATITKAKKRCSSNHSHTPYTIQNEQYLDYYSKDQTINIIIRKK